MLQWRMLSLLRSHYRVYKGIIFNTFNLFYSSVQQTSQNKDVWYSRLRKALDREGNFVFTSKNNDKDRVRDKWR